MTITRVQQFQIDNNGRRSFVPILAQGLNIPLYDSRNDVITPAPTPASRRCVALAFDGRFIWGTLFNSDALIKIDPISGTTTYITGFSGPVGLAYDGARYLWVTNQTTPSVMRVDKLTNTIVSTTAVLATPLYVCFDGTYAWVTNPINNTYLRIHSTTLVVDTFTPPTFVPLQAANPFDCVFDGEFMWFSCFGDLTLGTGGGIIKVNPDDPSTPVFSAAFDMSAFISFDGASIWLSRYTNATDILKIDSLTGAVRRTFVGIGLDPRESFFDGKHMWVGSFDGLMARIQIDTGEILLISPAALGTPSIPTPPVAFGDSMAFDGVHLWFSAHSITNPLTEGYIFRMVV